MKLFGRDLDREVAIVAEIGVNHEGSVEAASSLLKAAAEAGADAVKFQSYTPRRYASSSDPARLARVTSFALDEAAHRRLAAEAAELSVTFFSTPVTEDWVPVLDELCPVLKIASSDMTFEPVVRAAARTQKPVIVSTGLGTVEQIDRTVGWVRDEVGDALPERLVLMHCVTAYPTPIENANVRSVPFLAERYGVTVGYSNHVDGIDACLAAVAVGARVVEVHFTDQKEGRTFRDHQLSCEPAELAELVRRAPRIAASLGTHDKRRQDIEIEEAIVRKGVVAARDLPENTVLTLDDLMFARPGTEFDSSERADLVGRTLTRPLEEGQIVPRDAVQ